MKLYLCKYAFLEIRAWSAEIYVDDHHESPKEPKHVQNCYVFSSVVSGCNYRHLCKVDVENYNDKKHSEMGNNAFN